MKTSSVTIFGGSGFIGRHLIRELAKSGARIRIAVRKPNRAKFLEPLGNVGQILPVYSDLTDYNSVSKAIDGSNIIINLVGILHNTGKYTFNSVHVKGAENLAKLAKEKNIIRLVHISALGADKDSKSFSSRSKAEGEDAILSNFSKATVLRPSLIFGTEDKFFNRFASMSRFMPILPIFGNSFSNIGKTLFQPVYVEDIVKSVIFSTENASAEGKVFELGGPKQYSYKELMSIILDITGRKRMLLPVNVSNAKILAFFLEMLPGTLLTRDQLTQIMINNIVSKGAYSFSDMNISPTPLETIVPEYLLRFRKDSAVSIFR